MSFDAGVAQGRYLLDISDAKKGANELRALFAAIRKDQDALGKGSGGSKTPFAPMAQDALKAQTALQKLAQQHQKTADSANKTALSAQKLATEQQRTVTSATNAGRAQQQLARDTANAAAAQDRATAAALRRRQAEERAARQSQNGGLGAALPRTFAGFTGGGLAQAAGAFGLATIGPQLVGQAISAGVEAGKASLALERTLRLTRELTGTQAVYNRVIETARKQQELYGGSLQENIAGIQGLVVTARSTGAELTTLINLSQRLAVLDPAQGTEGARIALSEILAGDPRSLSRRYEIPLAALEKIKDESIPVAERLLVLDKYLSKIGITSEVAANSVTNQAKAYNRLGIELGDLQTNTGSKLADTFEGAATGIGRLIGVYNQNPRAIAEIRALLAGKSEINQDDIDNTARNLRVADVSDAAENARKARLVAAVPTSIGGTFDNAAIAQTAALEATKNRLIVYGATSDDARQKTVALLNTFGQTGDINAFIRGVRELETSTTRGTKAIQENGAALKNELADKVKSQIETEKLAFQQKQLETDSLAAVNGLLGAGNQAEILAKKYGLATSEAQFLIDAQARLSNRIALEEQRAGERAPGSSGAAEVNAVNEARQQAIFQRLSQPARDRAAREAKALRDSENDLTFKRAKTSTERIALLQKELAGTTDQIEKNRILGQIEDERNSKRAAATKSPLNADFKADLKLSDDLIERLKVLEDKLKTLKVGSAAYKDVLAQIRDVKEKINDETEKELDLITSIALAKVKDRQSLRDEQRETVRLQRVVGNSRFSPEVQAAAQDRLDEINLEQAKRKRDILRQERQAGKLTNDLGNSSTVIAPSGLTGNVLTTSAGIPSTPFGSVPQIAAGSPTTPLSQNVVNVYVMTDKDGRTTANADSPNAIVNVLLNTSRSAFAGGGK